MGMIVDESSEPRAGIKQSSVLAWLRLLRVFHKVERRLQNHCRGSDLSVAQFDVLAHVGANEGMTQQQLANALLVTKGNVCQILDRMECTGTLERRQEGRANRLFLTEKGRDVFHVTVPAHEVCLAEAFKGLDAEEQAQLLRLLRKLDRSLD